MTHADLVESKTLEGHSSLSSEDSYPKLAAAQRESHISSVAGPDVPPWIDNVPFSDWEIDVADIVIGVRPDGRKWELGAGAFSRVGPVSLQRETIPAQCKEHVSCCQLQIQLWLTFSCIAPESCKCSPSCRSVMACSVWTDSKIMCRCIEAS